MKRAKGMFVPSDNRFDGSIAMRSGGSKQEAASSPNWAASFA